MTGSRQLSPQATSPCVPPPRRTWTRRSTSSPSVDRERKLPHTSHGRQAVSQTRPQGELAIVLHTHMPYVEGFGTWPFGEEWLWEAISGSYLPLLDLLDEGAPLSLSLTPVLCDQLEAPGVGERFEAFVGEVRRHTHAQDIEGLREGGHEELARELQRSWGEYERALERFRERGGDLLGALGRHAQWTSSATHAV